MKKLMLGNEAVARGLYEAGCAGVFSYPGTPSTEITEYASKYEEVYCEWAPNEKVALESAFGFSLAGKRALCAMKHVGLNVAADPLYTMAYTGVNAGLVIAVADDPGMHSSQNEQDTRSVAKAAKVPVLEPVDSADCKELTKLAFEMSERFDTPVILRLTTRISHTRGFTEENARQDALPRQYKKDFAKYGMVPAVARLRRFEVEKRLAALLDYAESSGVNRVSEGCGETAVIANGISCSYAKEANVSGAGLLELRMTNPLPVKLIRDFAAGYKEVVVAEELDPVIEEHCRAIGVNVKGRELFSGIGELSQTAIAEKLKGEKKEHSSLGEALPGRAPALCAGCPHHGVFYVLAKLGITVCGDIGCYALGAAKPLSAVDFILCMGASISALHGMLRARPELAKSAVAVIGDSTFIHSGITGLIDLVYNRTNGTVLILDNSITGMTGHQNNPANGFDLYGNAAPQVDLAEICRACGVSSVRVCDPNDIKATEACLKEELQRDCASVIIMRSPCALLKGAKRKPAFAADRDKCKGCRSCTKLGCPAIAFVDKKAVINAAACTGCGACAGACAFGAITGGEA